MHSKAFFSTLFSAYSIISVHAGICENKHIIESKPLTMPSGNVITMEIFNCSNTVAVPFQQQPSESSATDRRHFLDLSSSSPRDASRRTASNSVCGIPCFFTGCFPTNGASTLEDCPDLALSLMQRTGTFIIPANLILGFMSANCIFGAYASSTEDTQYCFNDMGVAAYQIVSVCSRPRQQGSCESIGGELGVLHVHIPLIILTLI